MSRRNAVLAGMIALTLAGGSLSAFAQAPAPAQKTPEQKREARAEWEARFKAADKNGDGGLSKAELEASMDFRSISRNFDAMDTNKDGKVTRDEYRAWGKARREARKSQPPQQ
jgi:Ca2+-binding EF-hand superfamily protein